MESCKEFSTNKNIDLSKEVIVSYDGLLKNRKSGPGPHPVSYVMLKKEGKRLFNISPLVYYCKTIISSI